MARQQQRCRRRRRTSSGCRSTVAAETGSTDSNGSSSTSEPRRVDHRSRDRDLLDHPRRVVGDQPAEGMLEAEGARPRSASAQRDASRSSPRRAPAWRRNSAPGEAVEQPKPVGRTPSVSSRPPHGARRRRRRPSRPPASGPQQPGDHRERGGLAGPVGADEPEEPAPTWILEVDRPAPRHPNRLVSPRTESATLRRGGAARRPRRPGLRRASGVAAGRDLRRFFTGTACGLRPRGGASCGARPGGRRPAAGAAALAGARRGRIPRVHRTPDS